MDSVLIPGDLSVIHEKRLMDVTQGFDLRST
jgi:hypothetical protein